MQRTKWLYAFRHLRIHFSFLLMPVFLFALSQSKDYQTSTALLIFIILHILVYPASNAFNSYHDQDTGSIGGMKNPPPTNKQVLYLANSFDLLAIALSLLVSVPFTLLIVLYIVASRMYSHRAIRLKKFPLSGFLVVVVFQGIVTYFTVLLGLEPSNPSGIHTWAGIAASLQIAAMYPLTQMYQHESDEKDGVKTLSMLLGYQGTFVFSGLSFSLALVAYIFYFQDLGLMVYLLLFQAPIIVYYLYWFILVRKNQSNANFKHMSRFTLLSASCLNLFYLSLVLKII